MKILRKPVAPAAGEENAAHALLCALMKHLLHNMSVAWITREGYTLVIEKGQVNLEVLRSSQKNAKTKIGRSCGDSCIVGFMLDLLQHARGRHPQHDRDQHYTCLQAVMDKLGLILEMKALQQSADKDADHLMLGVLHGRRGLRRIPGAFKRAVAEEVSASKRCRRASQLLAGVEVATKRIKRGGSCVAARTGDSFEAFTAYQYFLGCRELFANEKIIGLALDGTYVCGGKDSISFAAWSSSQEIACWLPTQVGSQKTTQTS